jgi:hypothetical protein
MSHYAILVAISRYPGLTNLDGPENDVDDMYGWLCDPQGGNVQGDNVKVIKSSSFPMVTDRYQAQPAEVEFKRVVTELLWQPDGQFKNRVGERLYLFFAGHGFASKRLAEAALYTAQASPIDPDHIASKRYMERIANSAAFDEIVLVMDCCRTVDLSDSIRDPVLKIPDRQGLASPRILEAYGAGRGKQARERQLTPGGPVRGLFTYAFVDALRNANGNANDEVTGALVKGHVLNRWPTLFQTLFSEPAPYEPEITPPPGSRDIVFVRRQLTPKVEVSFKVNPPAPLQGSMIIIENGSRTEVVRVPYDPVGTRIFLPDGLYTARFDGIARTQTIDASGPSVEVTI